MTNLIGSVNGGIQFSSSETVNSGEEPITESFVDIATPNSQIKIGAKGITNTTTGQIANVCHNFLIDMNTGQNIYQDELKEYIKGNHTILVGRHDDKAMADAKTRQDCINKVERTKSDAIKNTAGDKIPCPLCEQKYVHDKSDFMQKIISFISSIGNMLPYNCFDWPITQFFMNMVVIPSLSEISGLAASSGKGCGTCKKGVVETSQSKIQAANDAGAKELKNLQPIIDSASANTPPAAMTLHSAGDVMIKAGLVKNDAEAVHDGGIPVVLPIGLQNPENTLVLRSSQSPPNQMINNPVTKTVGSIMLDSANDISILAGSPGISIKTDGNFKTEAGSLDLVSAKGALNISSKNVTTISGNIVVIDTKDNGGLTISGDTHVAGAFSASGGFAAKGAVTCDGPLAVPFLQVPSMRGQVKSSSSAKSVTDGATWYFEGSTLLTAKDMAMTAVLRDLKPGYTTSLFGILTLIQEMYNMIMGLIPVHVMPIGFSFCCTCGIVPVFGFRHTHSLVSQDHDHSYTLARGNYYNDVASWEKARANQSSTPIPPPGQGDGPSPGPKSLGGCGGGGGGFNDPNSAVSKNRKSRNASVGLSDGDYNYTRITIGDGNNWTYDPNGNLVPDPSSGLTYDC